MPNSNTTHKYYSDYGSDSNYSGTTQDWKNVNGYYKNGTWVLDPKEPFYPPSKSINQPSTTQGGSVNFNTASIAQLVSVPRIGDVTARAVVKHRKRHGPFTSSEQLIDVKGIGKRTHARIKKHVRLSGKTKLK